MSFRATEDSRRPVMLIITGLPGTGKSFLAEWISHKDPTWKVASQPDEKQEGQVHDWIQQGFNVLIDDVNAHVVERAKWIRIAKVYQIKCCVCILTENFQKLIARLSSKGESKRIRELHVLASQFEPLNWKEGYDFIIPNLILPDKQSEASSGDPKGFDQGMESIFRNIVLKIQ